MADKDMTVPEPRFETVQMMRRADDEIGVLSLDVTLAWVREIRARTVVRVDGSPERPLTSYPSGPGYPDAIGEATAVAAITARAYSPFKNAEIAVVAELWEVPMLADGNGGLRPLSDDWFLEDDRIRNLWLLAASQGQGGSVSASRPQAEMIESATVWNSRSKGSENHVSLEEFMAVAMNGGQAQVGPWMGI